MPLVGMVFYDQGYISDLACARGTITIGPSLGLPGSYQGGMDLQYNVGVWFF